MKLGTVSIKRKELLHQGKANNVWSTTDPDVLELEASDRISAGNGLKNDVVPGKGEANNLISSAIFTKLEQCGIPTHYVGPGSNEASKIVKRADPIPLEVIGRFKAAGSFSSRYEIPEFEEFDGVYIEYTYKSDATADPVIPESAITAMKLLTKRELGYVEYMTERVAYVLWEFFANCNADLIDFKIEFGRLPNGQIVVIDEISPDTCRIRDRATCQSLDKDRFRKDLGNVAEAYTDMATRVSALTSES